MASEEVADLDGGEVEADDIAQGRRGCGRGGGQQVQKKTSIIELEPCKKCDNEEHSKETCPTAQALAVAQAAAHNTYYKVISRDPSLPQNRGVDDQSFQE